MPYAPEGLRFYCLALRYHLKTPTGEQRSNHDYAEIQYRVLTGQSDLNIGDLYVPIFAAVMTHTLRRK